MVTAGIPGMLNILKVDRCGPGKDRRNQAVDGKGLAKQEERIAKAGLPFNDMCSKSILLYVIIERQNNLDGINRDMATAVVAVNTGEDVHGYYPH